MKRYSRQNGNLDNAKKVSRNWRIDAAMAPGNKSPRNGVNSERLNCSCKTKKGGMEGVKVGAATERDWGW